MTAEEKLLQRLQSRDVCALEQAIDTYTPYVTTVIWRAAGASLPREDVEEIVCDVFVVLWENAGRIDPAKGTLRSYMAAAARNFVLKRLRSRREQLPLEESALFDAPDPAADWAANDALWDAVMALGEPDSELFVRYYRYGEPLWQIAAATGLKLSAVKSRLSRGRRKLKTMLTDAEDTI